MKAVYVCVCNAITERELRQAIDQGARSLDDLAAMTGCGTCCGSCRDTAVEMLGARSNVLAFPLRTLSVAA